MPPLVARNLFGEREGASAPGEGRERHQGRQTEPVDAADRDRAPEARTEGAVRGPE